MTIVFDMAPRLEPINAAHPNVVALLTGPLALFPIDPGDTMLNRAQWLSARRRGHRMGYLVGNRRFGPQAVHGHPG